MSDDDVQGGTLYIVSTPIGNLRDITYRAVEILSEVDLIAAEDTRHTKILLNHYNISTSMTSYFDFNKEKKLPALIDKLKKGKNLALVSDAGTPGISDPAYRLVNACIDEKLNIETAPGATALIPALVLSGLPTDRFVFEGFLPQKKGRKTRLEALQDETRTIIFYESPHRLTRTLKDLLKFLGDRKVVVLRELTKKFEEVVRTNLEDLNNDLSQVKIKGEFVLVVGGKEKQKKEKKIGRV